MKTFEALGLNADILASVAAAGFTEPTAIQAQAIPPLLEGKDVLGQARTGTGKTAAFLLPLLQGVDLGRRQVQGLVLAPTRELAMQVAEAAKTFSSKSLRLRVTTVYGGQAIHGQIKQLNRGVHLVVGTPGRTLDLLKRGALDLSGLDYVVLDEADEMLQMGFVEDIETILGYAPTDRPRQTALFSATFSPGVRKITTKHTRDPVNVKVTGETLTVAAIKQQMVLVRPDQKVHTLDRLLEAEAFTAALVFARTRVGTAQLAESLERLGHPVAALHGDLSQAARETVVRRFREGLVTIVVATDVAARGLDINIISHVINFDPPTDPDGYVHRIGRTGRAGREGTAITLATHRERRYMAAIERHIKQRLDRRSPPDAQEIRDARAERLKQRVVEAVSESEPYLATVEALVQSGMDVSEIAAAALRLAAGSRGLDVPDDPPARGRGRSSSSSADGPRKFRIPMGRNQKVRVGDIVGVLCGDLGVSRNEIGRIDVGAHRTEVWLSGDAAEAVLAVGKIYLRGRPTPATLDERGGPPPPAQKARRPYQPTGRANPDDGRKKGHPGRKGGPKRSHPHG